MVSWGSNYGKRENRPPTLKIKMRAVSTPAKAIAIMIAATIAFQVIQFL
jgi:hypothetical protein